MNLSFLLQSAGQDRWTQNYAPWDLPWWASALVAAIPVALLFWGLAIREWSAPRAAIVGALAAVLVATLAQGMPWSSAGASFVYGAAYGLFPIGWVVFAAMFLFQIAVDTGQFDVMKASIARLTADRRLQVLLIAFSFGAIIEGAAGFGTPVAISAALLVGLGFRPFQAAVLCLIANTAPVAWGSVGTPLVALAKVSGLPIEDLSAMNARILPITSVIVPIWLVRAMVPWRETLEVLPAILVSGLSFALTQFFWGNWVDVGLVDIVAGLASLGALALFLCSWRPKTIWRFPEESGTTSGENAPLAPRATLRAWLPFLVLFVFVLGWGLVRAYWGKAIDGASVGPLRLSYSIPAPALHDQVLRAAPVGDGSAAEEAIFKFNWLTATGTGVFVACAVTALLLGHRPRAFAASFARTAMRMRVPLLAIAGMLALGHVTRYSGMDAILGLAFTRTGWLYPFFGTFLGWLGVALTGSDTASNVLFGSLQRITAEGLGLSPVLMCSANSAGGVMGKMVDAQSIVVAATASNLVGQEGKILRAVVVHSIALAAIVAFIVMAYAYLAPDLIPTGVRLWWQ